VYARHVTIKLKANSANELTRAIENEILPLLRKQKGFRDEIVFVAPERAESVAISFWDTKEDAEAYNRTGYSEVLKAIANVMVAPPTVAVFKVATSSFNKLTASGA
jgi:heme-degrading monooxygenase HmoA